MSISHYRSSLFHLKFEPLQSQLPQISRNAICEKILAAPSAKLILLNGAAGVGKSTVMTQLKSRFETMGITTAWLNLDPVDNNLSRFLSVLARSLEGIFPGLISSKSAEISTNPGGLALELLDRIAAQPSPFAVFIDDLNTVSNPSALELIEEIVNQLPKGTQIILSTTKSPRLNFSSLQNKGIAIEFGEENFLFDHKETEKLFTDKYKIEPKGNNLRLIHRITNGSPIALQLLAQVITAVHLNPCHNNEKNMHLLFERLSKPRESIVNELITELLSLQDKALQYFMMAASALPVITEDALTEIVPPDQAKKEECIHRILCSPLLLHGQNNNKSYHPLISDALKQIMSESTPDDLNEIHARAAHYSLSKDYIIDAIEHAFSANDDALSSSLLSKHADRLLAHSHMRLLIDWLTPFVETGKLDEFPILQAVYAWAILFTNGPLSARSLGEALTSKIDNTARKPNLRYEELFQSYVIALKPTLLNMLDDLETYNTSDPDIQKVLHQPSSFASSTLSLSLTNIELADGRFDEAQQVIDSFRQSSDKPEEFSAFFDAHEAHINLVQGHLCKATKQLRQIVDPEQITTVGTTNGITVAGLLLASAIYEVNECELSERLVRAYLPMVKDVVIPEPAVRSYTLLARLLASNGLHDKALNLLTELEFHGYQEEQPRAILIAKLERARLHLSQNNHKAAMSELDSAQQLSALPTRATEVETYTLGIQRYAIRTGNANSAIPALEKELSFSESHALHRRSLTLRILLSEATWRTKDHPGFITHFEPTLKIAIQEGYVRPFIDEGKILIDMLEGYLNLPHQKPAAYKNKAKELIKALNLAAQNRPRYSSEDILTRKEMQILQLLTQGLSNQELANRLIVAETTVRTHLRNINLKLGVNNRTAVVAEARRLGLIQ